MRSPVLVPVLAVLVLSGGAAAGRAEPAPAADEQLLRAAGVAVDGPGLLEYFRQRTALGSDQERIAELVRRLGDKAYPVRARASAELVAVGAPALNLLRQALADTDAEVHRRADQCIQAIEDGRGAAPAAAAARLLRVRAPAGAVAALLDYLPWADGEAVEEEVVQTLLAVGVRDGRADPALVAALRQKSAPRRAAAAQVLGRAGSDEQKVEVRRLLADLDPHVRLRSARGLLAAGDKGAVPTLIALLTEAPLDLAERADDLLQSLANDQGPTSVLVDDRDVRCQCRDGWRAWWRAHGPGLDLARAAAAPSGDPASRAGGAARRFLKAWVIGDPAILNRLIEFPFVLRGEMTTRDRLDKYMAAVPSVWKQQQLTIPVRVRIPEVVNLRQYAGRGYDDGGDLLAVLPRPGEVRAVYVHSNVYRGAVLVRVRGNQARVVGLGTVRVMTR
jgi:hypothetical protein